MRSVIHRVRLHEWSPAAITCLKPTSDGSRLAVGRANGDIEIWLIAGNSSLCDQRISGKPSAAPRSVAWKAPTQEHPHQRLFSAGDNGEVVEWDLATLGPKSTERSFGGVIWSLAIDPSHTRLAAACEDGGVRIYNILDPAHGVEFAYSLTRQEARLLSIAWDVSGERVVTGGSDGNIRVWDLKTRNTSLQISVAQGKRKRANAVWAVDVLRDGTIVSGDSLGQVQMFEAEHGTRTKSFSEHQADVRALAVDEGGRFLFSSGVDAVILKYSLGDDGQWVLSDKRSSLHTHDVQSLACAAGRLFSGGVDTVVVSLATGSAFTTNRPTKLLGVPRGLLQLAGDTGLALLQHERSVQLRAILAERSETAMFDEHDDRSFLSLAEIRIQEGERNVAASAVAGDERRALVAVSDGCERTLLYAVEAASASTLVGTARAASDGRPYEPPAVRPIALPPRVRGAHSLSFTRDGRRLVVAGSEGSLHILDTSEALVRLLASFPLDAAGPHSRSKAEFAVQQSGPGRGRKRAGGAADEAGPSGGPSAGPPEEAAGRRRGAGAGPVGPVAVSGDGQWAAVADRENRLLVYGLDTLRLEADLGALEGRVAALAFHPRSPSSLVAACASKRFFIFDVERGGLSEWSREYSSALPEAYLQAPGPVSGLAFDPARPSALLISSPRWLCSVDLEKPVATAAPSAALPSAEKRKRKRGGEKEGPGPGEAAQRNFVMTDRYRYVLGADYLGPSHLLLVERTWPAVLHSLPPAFASRRYGT